MFLSYGNSTPPVFVCLFIIFLLIYFIYLFIYFIYLLFIIYSLLIYLSTSYVIPEWLMFLSYGNSTPPVFVC